MSTLTATKGVLGTKLGMTQVWDDKNRVVPVTVIEVSPNVVTQIRTADNDGYDAIQIAAVPLTPARSPSPSRATLTRPVSPLVVTSPRFAPQTPRTTPSARSSPSRRFEAGAVVDVVGTSKGKGTAGVMKRHNFAGVSASHGAHRNHRKPGSIGASATPSRVFKGMRMAGRMGNERVTMMNLTVVKVDAERNLLLIKGAVPGPKGRLVFVRNARKGA
jgi:large subunit ribosomal protein L3